MKQHVAVFRKLDVAGTRNKPVRGAEKNPRDFFHGDPRDSPGKPGATALGPQERCSAAPPCRERPPSPRGRASPGARGRAAAHAGSFVRRRGDGADYERLEQENRPDQGGRGERSRSGARRPAPGGLETTTPGIRHGARPALPSSPASHLHGAFRPQVGPQHVLQTPGRADVDRQRCLGSGHLGFGVQALHGRHR